MTRKTVIIIFFILWIFNVHGQENTLYLLHKVPQAITLNPAIHYGCEVFVELPVLSSVKVAVDNSGFAYSDLIKTTTEDDKTISSLDISGAAQKLKEKNFIGANLDFVMAGVGFPWREKYITIRLSHKLDVRFDYTKSLFDLHRGNWDFENMQAINHHLDGNGLFLNQYFELAFGIAKKVSTKRQIGFKFKYLNGTKNLTTTKSKLDVNSENLPRSVDFRSEYEIKASMPIELKYRDDGSIRSAKGDMSNPISDFKIKPNHGFAFDFGLIEQFNDKLQLNFSVIDLGFINWTEEAQTFNSNYQVGLEGFDFRDYTNNLDQRETFQALEDSLRKAFNFREKEGSYMTFLSPKAFLGVHYTFNKYIGFGYTARTILYNLRPYLTTTVAAFVHPIPLVDLTVNWSYKNNSLRNIGAGLVINKKPFQFYIMTDNIITKLAQEETTGVILPQRSRSVNIWFGINLMLGCKKKNYKGGSKGMCPAYGRSS